ncbi:MAG: SUMF1/EgtB/PvdO family nonheme iron enzyme [Planctomycetaceae bacterium]|nr:SUMF1/EgtB/PvdO family nonheme iron enzyme [Planctomycetaceae bacterium]
MSGNPPSGQPDNSSRERSEDFRSQGEKETRIQGDTANWKASNSSWETFQKVLPERYQIVRVIGQGGMGQVLLAIDRGPTLKDHEFVAIKRMLGPLLSNSGEIESFLAEVKLARSLRHPNVVKMYHSDNTSMGPYIVMEYIDGMDLGEYLTKKGPLSEAQALACFRKIAGALDEGHQRGIIHRDLKPRNILISKSGQPYLADFGIAHVVSDSDKTGTGMGAGTLAYMSPEQLDNRKPDAKQDIYSLGATLFHAVEGRPPFEAASTPRLIAKILGEPAPRTTRVSVQFAERIAACLAKDPSSRPASCQDVFTFAVRAELDAVRTPPQNTKHEVNATASRLVRPKVSNASSERLQSSNTSNTTASVQNQATLFSVAIVMVFASMVLMIWQPWRVNTPKEQDEPFVEDALSDGEDRASSFSNNSVPDRKTEASTPLPEASIAGPTVTVPSPSSTPTGSNEPLPESFTNSIGMEFRLIKPGSFLMGSANSEAGRDDDEIQHEVTISSPYYLGIYEVTQRQYEKLMGTNPSVFKGRALPVDSVSWEDSQEFIRRLNSLPSEQSEGRIYRLPTEAEWEYACRAGDASAYSFGADVLEASKFGWFADNSAATTHVVGEKQPNAWGFHDMHGNVCEWCSDWYGAYPATAVVDPAGPISGTYRVDRGSSWNSLAELGRSADRKSYLPSLRSDSDGFRIALSLSRFKNGSIAPTDGSSESGGGAMNRITNGDQSSAGPVGLDTDSSDSFDKSSNAEDLPALMTNSVDMQFRLISPGKFLMGSPASEIGRGEDEVLHEVTIQHPFYLGVYEVTQDEFEQVMHSNPSRFKGSRNPVESVSWEDAQEFIRRLSTLPAEQATGRKYRLPTEAEWEYACRAGTKSGFGFGNSESLLSDYGWYNKNSSEQTHPVGEKRANAWGLYDMHGNVWEWCEDWYGAYPSSAVTDPKGPVAGSNRVLRGGSWGIRSLDCRSAHRDQSAPSDRFVIFGMRLIVEAPVVTK